VAIEALSDVQRASASAFAPGGGGVTRYYGTTAPDPNVVDEWVYTPTGRIRRHDGDAWFEEPGINGDAGPAIEVQTNATHIQWRVVGSTTWIDLIALTALDGAEGPSVELQTGATHIQWRVVGASTWIDLVPLASLAGPQGIQGVSGANAPTVVTLSEDQAFSATAIADVTNMPTLTLAANTDYEITLLGAFRSAASTTGIGLCLNVGGTVTQITGHVQHPINATSLGTCSQEANNAVTGATTGVRVINQNISIRGKWFVRMGATGGTAQLRCRSEIASSAVTLQAGMRLMASVV
jgi:hypothetical protein